MKIESKFQKKKPVLSFEIFPPKRDKAIQNIDETLAILSELNPDFISVTFGAGGSHTESRNKVEDIAHLKEKVDSGVQHLISQLFFDNNAFYSFREHIQIAGMHVPVEAGIMPVINKAQIERMVTLCGASLPEKFSRVMHKYEDNKEALFDAGMAYAINQIVDLLAHDVDGIHIYTMNNPIVAKRICDGIKNLI